VDFARFQFDSLANSERRLSSPSDSMTIVTFGEFVTPASSPIQDLNERVH
jgi:hypothetical protein